MKSAEWSSEVNFELKPMLKLRKDHFSHNFFSFNLYTIINIAFRDFLLKQYNNLDDAHSK